MNRRAAGLALAVLFAAQLVVVATTAAREPHVDEIEYLHVGWLMQNGARLYADFFEHHSPLLFAPLAALAPEGEGVDVKPFAMRARWLFGLFGLLAAGALAALLWRVDPWGAVIAVSALFSTGTLWLRVIADIRAEPLALALFWIGVVCAVRSRGVIGGVGIGLLVLAGLITPKWPLTSAFVAIVWFVRAEHKLRGVLAALGVAFAGLLAIRAFTPLDAWVFHNFTVNAKFITGRSMIDEELIRANAPFLHAPALFRPLVIAVAAIVLLVRRDRIAALAIAFFAVAALELRFVLSYPYLWTHYFAMWSFAAAALFALVPRAVERIRFARPAVIAVALVVLWANAIALWAVGRNNDGPFWVSQRALASALKPGDTVWVTEERHPVSARDAVHYWFNSGPIMAAMGPVAHKSNESPLCAAVRRKSRLRFVASRAIAGLPADRQCFDQLLAGGRLRRTGVPDVFEVLP